MSFDTSPRAATAKASRNRLAALLLPEGIVLVETVLSTVSRLGSLGLAVDLSIIFVMIFGALSEFAIAPGAETSLPQCLQTFARARIISAQCGHSRSSRILPPKISTTHQPSVSYTHLRAHETGRNLVCRLLLEKKK